MRYTMLSIANGCLNELFSPACIGVPSPFETASWFFPPCPIPPSPRSSPLPLHYISAINRTNEPQNMFVERHIPLLREGATLVRLALMARRIVHVRVTPDLSALEETETSRGTGRTYHHALDDVEAVEMGEGGGGWVGAGRGGHDVGGGVPPVIVIRLKGKGQVSSRVVVNVEQEVRAYRESDPGL